MLAGCLGSPHRDSRDTWPHCRCHLQPSQVLCPGGTWRNGHGDSIALLTAYSPGKACGAVPQPQPRAGFMVGHRLHLLLLTA